MDHFAEKVQAASGQGMRSALGASTRALGEPERSKNLENGLLFTAERFLQCQTGGSDGYLNITNKSCQNRAFQRDKVQVNHIYLLLKVVWVS